MYYFRKHIEVALSWNAQFLYIWRKRKEIYYFFFAKITSLGYYEYLIIIYL